ncbi:MAG: cupin domain-containing protein [Bacteroidota bacterium]
MLSAQHWIEKLKLQPHPEGGYYRETYLSEERIPLRGLPERFSESRAFGTAIYFLITPKAFSAFHRLKSDEVWHFYAGSDLALHLIYPDGSYKRLVCGATEEAAFQQVVPAGCWFAAEVAPADGYALVGCTMAPGFDFADFELAEKKALQAAFPPHADLIARLTRN